MAREKGQIRIEIMEFFLENPDKILTTAEIAEATGIHKSVVSRALKILTEQIQIKKIKAGQYQLADFSVTSERSRADNQETIDTLLNIYDEVFPVVSRWVLFAMMKEEHRKAFALMRGLTDSADGLLSRWSKVHVGYDANPEQARQDVKLSKALSSASEPEEPEENEIRGWDAVNKKFID